MELINLFFISLSIIVIIYFIKAIKSNKRTNKFIEFMFLGIYFLILILFLFPEILDWIENIFGINNAINLFIYTSIFVLFLISFYFYRKLEEQRVEITKLVRIVAINNSKKRSVEKQKEKK